MPQNLHRIMYLIGSSLIYAAAYYAPFQLWWCAAVWPFVLWLYARSGTIRWYHGYIWAYITLALQLSGILYGSFYLMSGSTMMCIACFMLLIAIMALPGGVCFGIAQALSAYNAHYRMRPLWWLTLWLYVLWMEYASLLFIGDSGCIILSNLIFLSVPYRYIWPIAYAGKSLFLAWWLVSCITILYLFESRCTQACRGACILGGLLLIIWFTAPSPSHPPQWLKHIGIIRSSFLLDQGTINTLQHCARHIGSLCQEHHDLQIILLPESSLYHPDIISNWHALAHGEWSDCIHIPVIFGGYTLYQNDYHNTVAFIDKDRVLATFDKQHATPFIESIPSWFQYQCVEKMFYKLYGNLTVGIFPRQVWKLLPDIDVVPYICSELFCGTAPRDDYHTIPILALCNTRWAPPAVRELMLLGARCRAIEWQRDILFVAHHLSSWCGAHGEIMPLISEKNTCS